MPYGLIFARSIDPNLWSICLRNDQGTIFFSDLRYLPYEHALLSTGVCDYICEHYVYIDKEGFPRRDLTRILFFVSPAISNLNYVDCCTLYSTNQARSAPDLPLAACDNTVAAGDFRTYGLQTAIAYLPYLFAMYPNDAFLLSNAINILTAPIQPQRIPEVEKPPAVILAAAETEIKTVIEVLQPINLDKDQVNNELAELRTAFGKLQQQVDIAQQPQSIEITRVQESNPTVNVLKEELEDLRQQLITVKEEKNKPAVILTNTPAVEQQIIKQVETKPTQKDLIAESKIKQLLGWSYNTCNNIKQTARSLIPTTIPPNVYKYGMLTTSVGCLNWTTLAMAESNAWINRHQLWADPRSAITPGAICTYLTMASGTMLYLYSLRKTVRAAETQVPENRMANKARRAINKSRIT